MAMENKISIDWGRDESKVECLCGNKENFMGRYDSEEFLNMENFNNEHVMCKDWSTIIALSVKCCKCGYNQFL